MDFVHWYKYKAKEETTMVGMKTYYLTCCLNRRVHMKKLFWIILLIVFIVACNRRTLEKGTEEKSMSTSQDIILYEQITANDAKKIIDSQEDYVILDVRTKAEYDASHIENATLLPLDEIEEKVTDVLPDKNQQLLVYCRSGVRSKEAALQLAELGYTNIKEFGGIIDWPYDVVR